MEKALKYLRVAYRWAVGVVIELAYPFVAFLAAAAICYLFYLSVLIRR